MKADKAAQLSIPKVNQRSAIQHLTPVPMDPMMDENAKLQHHDRVPTGCCRRIWQVLQLSFQCFLGKIPPCQDFGLFNLFTAVGGTGWSSAVESSHMRSTEKHHFPYTAEHRIAFPLAGQHLSSA